MGGRRLARPRSETGRVRKNDTQGGFRVSKQKAGLESWTCESRAGQMRGAVGRILEGLQSSNLEKRARERERGMNNASLTRTWAHARPVRIAPRIPPALSSLVQDLWSLA